MALTALLRSMLNPTGSSWVLWMLMDMRPRWFRSRRLAKAWAMILCLLIRTRSSDGFFCNFLQKSTKNQIGSTCVSF